MSDYPTFKGASGIVDTTRTMSSWMDKLAESEHEAVNTNLETNYAPSNLGESSELAEQTSHEQNSLINELWADDHYYNNGGEILDDSSRVLLVANSRDKLNNEVADILKSSNINTMSQALDLLTAKYNERIATRYVKSNYNKLASIYTDDLNVFTNDDASASDFSKGATSRVNNVSLFDERYAKEKVREARYTSDDVKNFIKDYVNRYGSAEVVSNLKKEFSPQLIASTFVTEEEIVRYANRNLRLATRSYADIDFFAKSQLLKKADILQLKEILAKEFGEYRVNSYWEQSNLVKEAMFIDSREGDTVVSRLIGNDGHSLQANHEHKVDYKGLVKKAYQQLANGKSIDDIKLEVKTRYGNKTASFFSENETKNMADVEHKLGYFYHDASIYSNCDEMVSEFSKHSNRPMLLQAKGACQGCKYNAENLCTKAGMLLTRNANNISRREGRKIISSANELRLLSKDIVEGYVNELQANVDNTPVIKSFIGRLKEEVNPLRKVANKKTAEISNEFYEVFGNSFVMDEPNNYDFLDISLSNLI